MATRAVLWLPWLLVLVADAAHAQLKIGVVEGSPMVAQQLAAAAEAGGDHAQVSVAVVVAPVEPRSALAVAAHVCRAARAGAEAALTAGGPGAALKVAAAARAGLPLLLAGPAPPGAVARDALALLPPDEVAAAAAADVCRAKGWPSAVLLHEGATGARPAALLAPDAAPLALVARRLPPAGGATEDAVLRDLLLVLKKAGATRFVVWCGAACALRVLDAAQRVGLLGTRHSYLLLAHELHLHARALAALSHGGANVTALLPFDPRAAPVRAAGRAWRERYAARVPSAPRAPAPAAMVLARDAAALLAATAARLRLPALGAADCLSGRAAFHADTLLNVVRSGGGAGASGAALAWEAGGARRGGALVLGELRRGGRLAPAGLWAPGAGVRWTRPPQPAPPLPPDTMHNRTFTVLIAMNKPYVMKRESDVRLTGNERYEGFCIELIERLAARLGFSYTLVEQRDGKYGQLDPATGRWDGMLGRLIADEGVHFAITDLTMTAQRVSAVDFTTPFMTLGVAILFRTPRAPEPAVFAFLLPFSAGVWLWLALSYAFASLLLWLVGRLCPSEWQNPYPCVEEPRALQNQFTLANALWFTLGAVLLQGSEVAPVAYGTRAVASVWWLFALVITSSYTANLATLLAAKNDVDLIKGVQDLANNTLGIRYGAKAGGSTYTFFEHAQSEPFRTMFAHMKDQEMPKSNDLGIKWVMESDYKYAFLMESTTIEYEVERNCAVRMVGDLLDSKGYGIAMKKNSPYRQPMNLELLRLQESGQLRAMKQVWWKERHGGGACNQAGEFESSELSMNNFRGLWYVLLAGCALGVLVAGGELAARAARDPRHGCPSAQAQPQPQPQPYLRRLLLELRFALSFERAVKPVRGPLLTPTPSASSRSSLGSPPPPQPEEEPWEAGARGSASAGRRRRSSMAAAHGRLARHASGRSHGSPRRSTGSVLHSPRHSIRSPRRSPHRGTHDSE